MAMHIFHETVEITVPNSEAYKGAQLKGIKDSTVGVYYIQDDQDKKQMFLEERHEDLWEFTIKIQ